MLHSVACFHVHEMMLVNVTKGAFERRTITRSKMSHRSLSGALRLKMFYLFVFTLLRLIGETSFAHF